MLETTCASILSQKQKNKQYPIVYFSRKFSRPKLNYPIYNKELLAIVLGFCQQRHYLEEALEIEVQLDHQNLKQFISQTMLNSYQAHWLLQLALYNFTIYYCKGSLNLANSPSHWLDYLVEQEAIKKTTISKLMLLLANKLAIATTIRASKQYQVKECNLYTKSLIRVLSL